MKNLFKKIGGTLFLISVLLLFPIGLLAQDLDPEMSIAMTTTDNNLKWGPCPEFMPEGCNLAVLHGDPAKGNVDVFFKVAPNSDLPNHWHTSAERMILVSGEMEVTYEGEEPIKLKQGSYAYGPAGKPHSGRCGDAGPCVLFIAFEEPLDAFAVEE